MTSNTVSLHINRVEGAADIARGFARMAIDRRGLSRTPGLVFWKLLGTGHGRSFSVRDADPTTWGLFAVWESRQALTDFESSSSYARVWLQLAAEQWRAELLPTRWKGSWSGNHPFGPEDLAGSDRPVDTGGRVAVLTRARVRPTKWRAFAKAVPPVAVAVNETPGLEFSIGIGEAPIGLQATFSLWESTGAMTTFAYRHEAHREVLARTKTEAWYAEELFARFTVVSTTGTMNGRSL